MASKCSDADQVRRLLAIALVLDGASRGEAARQSGMDRQTLRDWVHRYNAEGIGGLQSRISPGRPPKLTTEQKAEFRALVIAGPIRHCMVWCAGAAWTCRRKRRGITTPGFTSARWASGCTSSG